MSCERRYFTTPIYYVNDQPHLGHAYTTLAADTLARFWRMAGAEVHFLTGTDEHGAKIAEAAAGKGMSPQSYVDQVSEAFREMVQYLNTSPDDFIRTTQPRHKAAVENVWNDLLSKGQIYLGNYAGWYAVRDEAFYEEYEIVDGKAPTGAPVSWVEEPCYFFRLSHWEKPLLDYYENHQNAIGPTSRYNEAVSFIKKGLRDLAISRSRMDWGIPVPHSTQHVIYVWLDALTNYISALNYPHRSDPLMVKFWPESHHLIGKDILIFHAVYWPAFLMAAGISLPKRIFVHGWWTINKEKMSKSLGNVVHPKDLVLRYGADVVRYFLLREIPLGQDGDFSYEALVRRLNEDLCNDFGNLSHRLLTFLQKYTHGKIPTPFQKGVREESLTRWGLDHLTPLKNLMNEQKIHGYVEEVMKAVQLGNQFMSQLAPWELCRGGADDAEKMSTGLHGLLCLLRDIGIFLHPILPETTEKLMKQMGQPASFSLDHVGKPLVMGELLPKPQPFFVKEKPLQPEQLVVTPCLS